VSWIARAANAELHLRSFKYLLLSGNKKRKWQLNKYGSKSYDIWLSSAQNRSQAAMALPPQIACAGDQMRCFGIVSSIFHKITKRQRSEDRRNSEKYPRLAGLHNATEIHANPRRTTENLKQYLCGLALYFWNGCPVSGQGEAPVQALQEASIGGETKQRARKKQ